MIAPVYDRTQLAGRGDVRRLAHELAAGIHTAAQVPRREVIAREAPGAAFLSMPALADALGLYVVKVATILPRPAGDPRPTIHAVVIAFSSTTGEPRAIFDGAFVTELKCAGVAALVTDRCARRDARVLAIAGAGAQARAQARAVCAVRSIAEIRIWARHPDRAAALARELSGELGVACTSAAVLDDAVAGADVIGTATGSTVPLGAFPGLRADVHINCMGGHTTAAREVPLELLRDAALVVEDVATAVAEAGAHHAGAMPLAALVAADPAPLRARRTVFSSTGHALLDLFTAAHLLRALGAGDLG